MKRAGAALHVTMETSLQHDSTESARLSGLRVVHVVTVGMSFTLLRSTFDYLRAKGVELHAVSSPGPDLDYWHSELDLPVHEFRMPRRISPLHDILAVLMLWRLLRRLQPAIVHAHTPKAGLIGMLAAKAANVPVRIYHLRGLPLEGARGWKRHALIWAERTTCRIAHRTIAVGHTLRSKALQLRLVAPARIVVLENGSGQGVDAKVRFDQERLQSGRNAVREGLGIPTEAVVVGFVGRLARDKGVAELYEAWRDLSRKFNHLRLLIIGPDDERDPIPGNVRAALQRDPKVCRVDATWDVPKLYTAMDIVAFPTRREGFPNVPLEAAAMRLPVVASMIPECAEAVVDGVTGTLVPVGDARALTDALHRYIVDPELRATHGGAGRDRVLRQFDPRRIARATYDQYCALVKATGAPIGARVQP